jgi:hypothetical protein
MEQITRTPKGPQVRVQVTSELIQNAIGSDSSHCAIADGLRVAVPGVRKVSLDVQTIRFTDPKRPYRYTYLTPRTAAEFLTGWDVKMHQLHTARTEAERATLREEITRLFPPFTFLLRSAHVTLARSNSHRKRQMTPAQKAAFAKAQKAAQKVLRKSRLVQRHVGSVPQRIGGRALPLSRRRSYGLRAYEL